MARPTTWRRSFNREAFLQDQGSLDLLAVQPGETLGATWWSYAMTSLGTGATTTSVPMEGALPVVGLILQPESAAAARPLNDPSAEWLWWEQAVFAHVLYDANQGAYVNYAITGANQRKAEGMRRNDLSEDMVLRVCWQTWAGSGGADEVGFSVRVAASALVILP